MRHYVVLSNLTDEGRKTIRDNPERIKQVNLAGKAYGTKIVAQYILLGTGYDFLTIVEAKRNRDILKATMDLGSRGTMQMKTVPAIPVDEFIKELKE